MIDAAVGGHRRRWLGLGLAVALGLLGLALAATAALVGGWHSLQSLVPALVFCGGLSAGSLTLLLVHRLTGGSWGEDLRSPLAAAASALPLVGLLSMPLLVGLVHAPTDIYPWAAETARGADGLPARWYLNIPAFTVRTVVILLLWLVIAWSVGVYGARATLRPGAGGSAAALVLMVVSMTLIAFDWVMSLDPHWYSAVFGLLVGVAQTLAAMALATLWLALHPRRAASRPSARTRPRLSPDAGHLLLALLLLWGYLTLMQFVTIWIANLPDEIRWFVPRLQTGWRSLGLAWLVLLPGLALPLLLSRRVKTRPGALALTAGIVLLGQGLYALWLTLPTLRPAGPRFTPLDTAVLAGAATLWLAAYLLHLSLNSCRKQPASMMRGKRAMAMPTDMRQPPRGFPAVRDEVARTGTAVPVAADASAHTSTRRAALIASRCGAVPPGAQELEQEPSGIAGGTVVKVVAGIASVLVLTAMVLLPWRHQESASPSPPEAGAALLQNPVANLADYRATQHTQLREWRWMSRENGIARIPVERAIELLIAGSRSSTSRREADQ
jgi:hypothetical protein